MVKMRRAPAILLVILFSFSLAAPALFVDDQSQLPACCRRDGAHHCGMAAPDMADAPSSGHTAHAPHIRCPFFPNGGAVVPGASPALLAAAQANGVAMVSRVAALAHAEAGYRISFQYSHQKRGPPSLLS